MKLIGEETKLKLSMIQEIIQNDIETTKDIPYKGFGYYYEILHFNQLLRDDKKESDIMTFEFSKVLIETIDKVRNLIDLEY